MEFLIKCECVAIRAPYKNLAVNTRPGAGGHEKILGDNVTGRNFGDFLEFDVSDKKMGGFENQETDDSGKDKMEAFRTNITIPPLQMHQAFKDMNQDHPSKQPSKLNIRDA